MTFTDIINLTKFIQGADVYTAIVAIILTLALIAYAVIAKVVEFRDAKTKRAVVIRGQNIDLIWIAAITVVAGVGIWVELRRR